MKVLQKIWDNRSVISTIGTVAVSVVIFAHNYYVEPYIIRPIISNVVDDSLDVWVERAMKNRPAGFRSTFADLTGLNKNHVTDSLAAFYQRENSQKMTMEYLRNRASYQIGFNDLAIRHITEPYVFDNIKYRRTYPDTSTGKYDVYWKDVQKGYWWKAVFYADENAFFCFPSYANGRRIKCE